MSTTCRIRALMFILALGMPVFLYSQAVDPVQSGQRQHIHQLEDETFVQFLGGLTQVITETSRDIASHSLYVQIFISVIVAIFGAASIFLQVRSDKRHEEVQRRLEQQLQAERTEFNKWKVETFKVIKAEIEQLVSREVVQSLPNRVDLLFKEKYEAQIERQVSELSKEVLMRTPEARGFLLARLRRMITDVTKQMSAACGEAGAQGISTALNSALQDWHTLGQLFSADRAELEKGLLAIRANPFLETVPRLRRLRSRFSTDSSLIPLMDEALEKMEEMQNSVAVLPGG